MVDLTFEGNTHHKYFSPGPRNTIYLIKLSCMFLYGEDFCLLVSLIIFPQVGHTNMGLGHTLLIFSYESVSE